MSTDKFIKNLFISNTERYLRLSDNYFDLIANREVKLRVKGKKDEEINLSILKETMKFRGYQQIHDDQELSVIVVSG